MRLSQILPAVPFLLLLSGCATAPTVDTAAEETKLRDNETAWNKDMASKDIDKLVAHYTDDAALMAPGMPAMKGKDSIRGGLKTMFEDPNIKLEFAPQRVDVSKSGDMASTQGSYQMTMSDPKTKQPVTDKGSYVTVYKKQADGSWKAFLDINTSEVAPH